MAITVGKRMKTRSSANPHHRNFLISDLPKDIIINILCSLPTKTIIECKQVCKEWRNIILNSRFAEEHYSYTTATSYLSLVCYPRVGFLPVQDSIYLIEGYKQQDDYKLVSSRLINNMPSITDQRPFVVVNSCRGFLYLRTQLEVIGCGFHVYNPLTKQHFKIPPVVVNTLAPGVSISMQGLGIGSVTKQYKAVRLVNIKGAYDLGVHTVGTDHAWRRVEIPCDLLDKNLVTNGLLQLALNGILHWSFKPDKVQEEKIACFDVDKEELSEMALPKPCCQDLTMLTTVSIANIRGLLGVGIHVRGNHRAETELWVMREYGVHDSRVRYVVLKHDIVGDALPGFCYPNLYEVRDNGELLLSNDNFWHFQLFSYNPKLESSTKLRITDFDETMEAAAQTYVPGFFSIRSLLH